MTSVNEHPELWVSPEELEARYAKVRAFLEAQGLAALIVYSPAAETQVGADGPRVVPHRVGEPRPDSRLRRRGAPGGPAGPAVRRPAVHAGGDRGRVPGRRRPAGAGGGPQRGRHGPRRFERAPELRRRDPGDTVGEGGVRKGRRRGRSREYAGAVLRGVVAGDRGRPCAERRRRRRAAVREEPRRAGADEALRPPGRPRLRGHGWMWRSRAPGA